MDETAVGVGLGLLIAFLSAFAAVLGRRFAAGKTAERAKATAEAAAVEHAAAEEREAAEVDAADADLQEAREAAAEVSEEADTDERSKALSGLLNDGKRQP